MLPCACGLWFCYTCEDPDVPTRIVKKPEIFDFVGILLANSSQGKINYKEQILNEVYLKNFKNATCMVVSARR